MRLSRVSQYFLVFPIPAGKSFPRLVGETLSTRDFRLERLSQDREARLKP